MAGAWPMEPGRTQLISKYESNETQKAYDIDGQDIEIPTHAYRAGEVFIERGISRRLTLQGNFRYLQGQEGSDATYTRSTADLGLRFVAYQGRSLVISLYGGAAVLKSDQNQLIAESVRDVGDPEFRILVGRNFILWRRKAFAEVQGAQLGHRGKPLERRLESRIGVDISPAWQFLWQYNQGSNQTDAQWLKSEVSIVRKLGPASLQLGWRKSLAGQQTAHESGPVVGVWYRF
jgi:protein XagA